MATEALAPTNVTPGNNCEFASDRHANKLMWLNLWTILLFVLGSAVVLLLIVALILFYNADLANGAISIAGSAVSGVGAGYVIGQRKVAKEEEETAAATRRRDCKDVPTPTGTRNRPVRPLGLF